MLDSSKLPSAQWRQVRDHPFWPRWISSRKVSSNCLESLSAVVKSHVKNFGVILDSTFKFHKQINASFFQLHTVATIKMFHTFRDLEIVFHTFISSHLDYCNSLHPGIVNHPCPCPQAPDRYTEERPLSPLAACSIHVTACNIACERAPAPFVTATIGERSKVASYSEKRRAQSGSREERERKRVEDEETRRGRDDWDERGKLRKGRRSADENRRKMRWRHTSWGEHGGGKRRDMCFQRGSAVDRFPSQTVWRFEQKVFTQSDQLHISSTPQRPSVKKIQQCFLLIFPSCIQTEISFKLTWQHV